MKVALKTKKMSIHLTTMTYAAQKCLTTFFRKATPGRFDKMLTKK